MKSFTFLLDLFFVGCVAFCSVFVLRVTLPLIAGDGSSTGVFNECWSAGGWIATVMAMEDRPAGGGVDRAGEDHMLEVPSHVPATLERTLVPARSASF